MPRIMDKNRQALTTLDLVSHLPLLADVLLVVTGFADKHACR